MADTELSPQPASGRSVCVQAQQFLHPRLIKLGATASGASRLTPFRNHVHRIVFRGAKKEVLRITAQANVAGMTHAQAGRDCLTRVGKFPRNTMSTFIAQSFAEEDAGISIRESNPQPTGVRVTFVNVLPKASLDRGNSSCP